MSINLEKKKSIDERIRENVIWSVGVGGIIYMIVRVPDPNEGMLILLGTMIGIQAILTGTGSAKEIETLKAERDRALQLLDEQKAQSKDQQELIQEYRTLIRELQKRSHQQ